VSSTAGVIEHIQKLDEEKIPRPVKFIAIELLEAQDA
jgi:hypothetical protein